MENGEWRMEVGRAPVFAFGYAVAGRTEVVAESRKLKAQSKAQRTEE